MKLKKMLFMMCLLALPSCATTPKADPVVCDDSQKVKLNPTPLPALDLTQYKGIVFTTTTDTAGNKIVQMTPEEYSLLSDLLNTLEGRIQKDQTYIQQYRDYYEKVPVTH